MEELSEASSEKLDKKKGYEYYVDQARKYLSLAHNRQMNIAILAIKVCDITWGGRKSEKTITIAKFANDIGINAKTLNEWVRVRRKIYDELEPELRRQVSYEKLWRISRRVKASMNRKTINAVAADELTSPREVIKFRKYLGHMKAVLYNAKKPELLEFCTNELMFEMIYVSDLISKNLRTYIQENAKDRNLKNKNFQKKMYQSLVQKYEPKHLDV